MAGTMGGSLLKIENLHTYFAIPSGFAKAVHGIDLEFQRGDFVGIVGESGCGKSVTALSIMRLIQDPPGRIMDGRIWFQGRDLLRLSSEEMRKIRGNRISMIFQEPMTSLSPVTRIGTQVSEVMMVHLRIPKKEALKRALELLRLVEIPEPETRIREYPHQMSGGMRQRIMIAMALACDPDLIIADEPTTALDVTIQAQILDLMHRLKEKRGSTIMLITHNLGIVAENANRVVVMYAGRIIEEAAVGNLFATPLHPYTKGLLRSVPRMDIERALQPRLNTIQGSVPSLVNLAAGCTFHERCDEASAVCTRKEPLLEVLEEDHRVRCWKYR